MTQQDDDTPRQNVPTPESHGPTTNPPGKPARSPANEAEETPPADQAHEQSSDGATPEPDTSTLSERDRVQGAIEAILLASDSPLSRDELAAAFDDCEPELVDRALERIELQFSGPARGIHLERIADGWQLRTNPAYDTRIETLVESNPVSLSRAALEALAIVAYRQPVTRAEIDEIRGVDSAGVIRTLQDWDLVRVVGRLDDLGRPHVYGTTERFLEVFGLADLTDLPSLSEDEHESLRELYEDELDSFDEEFE